MKFYHILLATVFSSTFVIACNAQKSKTLIKGTVHNWPSDTIYLQTMPFHSPYSSELKFQTISKDSTFYFEFENSNKPFVVQLYSNKKNAELNKEQLLFLNLTEDYYYGHCVKFYTYGVTTYLIEPNKTLNIDLTYNVQLSTLTLQKAEKYRQQGIKVDDNNTLKTTQKTRIRFIEPNLFQNEYYQKSFDLDDKADKALSGTSAENIEWAISNLKNVTKSLLDNLQLDKDKLSPVFYDYIKAEIEFSAKNEFLKYLWSKKENYLKEIIVSGKIPDTFVQILAFDKNSINDANSISEEYNKFLEEYVNFLTNISNKEYNKYNSFNLKKLKIVAEEFPEKSIYYYVANQFLQIEEASEFKGIIKKFIVNYPNGELNSKLREKYKID